MVVKSIEINGIRISLEVSILDKYVLVVKTDDKLKSYPVKDRTSGHNLFTRWETKLKRELK